MDLGVREGKVRRVIPKPGIEKGFVREETQTLKELKQGKKTNFPFLYLELSYIFEVFFSF